LKTTDNVDVFFHNRAVPDFYIENRTKRWINKVVGEEGRQPGIITVVLGDDDFLNKLNNEYLHHDELTDVITFDYSSESNGISGDIFVSVERVEENAKEYGVGFREEFHRVIIHGVLHLIGYSDKDEQGAKEMREKENHYLTYLD